MVSQKADSGNATFDLTRIAKRNLKADATETVANPLYLPGCVELEVAQLDKGSTAGATLKFELKLDTSGAVTKS